MSESNPDMQKMQNMHKRSEMAVPGASQQADAAHEDLFAAPGGAAVSPEIQRPPSEPALLAPPRPEAPATKAVAKAAKANDMAAAQQALDQACSIPPAPNAEAAKFAHRPELTKGMTAGVLAGNSEFVHISLWDNCVEDGDVVEILINGESF